MNIWISTNTTNSNSEYGRRKDITWNIYRYILDYRLIFKNSDQEICRLKAGST